MRKALLAMMRFEKSKGSFAAVVLSLCPLLLAEAGCARAPSVSVDGLPLRHVVVYRNGVAYFERAGHVDTDEVQFKMKEGEVGDFLATLAVIEQGGSSVRSAAFPIKAISPSGGDGAEPVCPPIRPLDGASAVPCTPPKPKTEDERRGLKTVALSLDGKAHDLEVGYVAESPVWRPSYRLVVQPSGQADLQAWGIVQNLSGEDWTNVKLSLVAGAPLAFEAQLGTPIIPARPVVTDEGEVIAAVPKGETSLDQSAPPPPPAPAPEPESKSEVDDEKDMADKPAVGRMQRSPAPVRSAPAGAPKSAMKKMMPAYGASASAAMDRPENAPMAISAPRDLRSLAAVATQAGTTRYDLPLAVTVPDQSATMVLLLSKNVPGEASFLFAPDGGVPDSSAHPFRVARFTNRTGGALERGPIAVFEKSSFLGQGMVDPLPDGATATVPFALERSLAVDSSRAYDEVGGRVAKIENGALTVERDAVTRTTYRVRNGSPLAAKVLVKHPRQNGTRLNEPPKGTEDNVGAGSALVPVTVGARGSSDLVVDERATQSSDEDWFTPLADTAVVNFLADPKGDKALQAKLQPAWATRQEIVIKAAARAKLQQEQANLGQQAEETRRNLRAIEKNRAADALRVKLTQRLGETAARLDEATKQAVELDAKGAELRVRFQEALRGIVYTPVPTH